MTIPAGAGPAPQGQTTVRPVASLDMIFVSRYSRPVFALDLYTSGSPHSVDGVVTAALYQLDPEGNPISTPVVSRPVAEDGTGHYPFQFSSVETQTMGDYQLQFSYEINGSAEIYVYDIEIGPPARDYDALRGNWKTTVDNVWLRFADLYDSPYGGPNLQVYIQTKFGRNRLAQLMGAAISSLNNATLGHATFEVNSDGFDFAGWSGLLERSLYIEVLKHLQRSYVEQPEVILGTTVSRVDRRDYMQRWGEILSGELADFNRDLGRYKMANLGLGNAHVLVSGGAYGKLGPYANAGGAGQAAARGYFAVRRWH